MSKIFSSSPEIFDLNPYKQTNVQQHSLGTKAVSANGDIYRYTKINSTASDLIAGNLQVSLAREANHQNAALSAAAAVGDTLIIPTFGATAVDANEYEEGTLVFNDNSPEGETYSITKHDSNAGSLATNFTITPTLLTDATTASQVSLVRNPWNNPAISQLSTERACGVSIVDWDVSAANFGWLKTRGVAGVLVDTNAVAAGLAAAISIATNGAVGSVQGDDDMKIGQMMETGTATEFNSIYLTID